MLESPSKSQTQKLAYFTPPQPVKQQPRISNSEGLKPNKEILFHIEERLKENVDVIEYLNDSRFKRYKSRKRLKTLPHSMQQKSQKQLLLHVIEEKLKWKGQEQLEQIVQNESMKKIYALKKTVGQIKQLNCDSLNRFQNIKGSQIQQLFITPEKKDDQRISQQCDSSYSKSQQLIRKYQKQNIRGGYKLEYSGISLKGQYKPPQYIKPSWMKSNTSNKKRHQMPTFQTQKHSRHRSLMNIHILNENIRTKPERCNCLCHGKKLFDHENM